MYIKLTIDERDAREIEKVLKSIGKATGKVEKQAQVLQQQVGVETLQEVKSQGQTSKEQYEKIREDFDSSQLSIEEGFQATKHLINIEGQQVKLMIEKQNHKIQQYEETIRAFVEVGRQQAAFFQTISFQFIMEKYYKREFSLKIINYYRLMISQSNMKPKIVA
jgi:hypothetical protein